MDRNWRFRNGMQVYTDNDRVLGKIDRFDDNGIYIGDRLVPRNAIRTVDNDRIYLDNNWVTRNWTTTEAARGRAVGDAGVLDREGEVRVPVVEERLNVEKRAGQIGEVGVRKEVVEERVNVPVELTREEVRVQEVDVPDRPLRPGELDAFKEGTIRVPVRGEEAFVEKQAVVTGEVVINKERVTERQNVQDTVRKERVEVDRDFEKARPTFMEHFNRNRTRAVGSTTRSFEEAEHNYRFGWEAARDPRFQGRRFEEIEPDLRREYTTRYATTTRPTSGRDPWEELREEVREGFERLRG